MNFLLVSPEVFLAHKTDQKRSKKGKENKGQERRGEEEESKGKKKEGETRTITFRKLLEKLDCYSISSM